MSQDEFTKQIKRLNSPVEVKCSCGIMAITRSVEYFCPKCRKRLIAVGGNTDHPTHKFLLVYKDEQPEV